MVIINLQATPLDELADLIINALIDDVWVLLMKKLGLKIPEFKLNRLAKVELDESKSGKESIRVSGIDYTGMSYEIFKNIQINGQNGEEYILKEDEIEN